MGFSKEFRFIGRLPESHSSKGYFRVIIESNTGLVEKSEKIQTVEKMTMF